MNIRFEELVLKGKTEGYNSNDQREWALLMYQQKCIDKAMKFMCKPDELTDKEKIGAGLHPVTKVNGAGLVGR